MGWCVKKARRRKSQGAEADSIKEVQYEYLLKLAETKYEQELQREQGLIQHSNQLQAVFSFMSAALLMALPVALDHRGNLSKGFFIVSVSVVLFFLLLSLVLAALASWRWKMLTLGNIRELREAVIDSPDWEENSKHYNQLNSQISALEEIQISKEKVNDRRTRLIISSMVAFFCSVATCAICYILALAFH